MNKYILSILIPTTPDRINKLNQLLNILKPQQDKYINQVQLLTLTTPTYKQSPLKQNTIGYKRQELINQAQGSHCCFIDSDDKVDQQYIELILEAIRAKPDCTHCSLLGQYYINGKLDGNFQHSNKYNEWKTNKKGNIKYQRYPNHLNVIKTDIVKKYKFKEIMHGQDRDFSDRIKKELTNEAYIANTLYYYYFENKKNELSNRHRKR